MIKKQSACNSVIIKPKIEMFFKFEDGIRYGKTVFNINWNSIQIRNNVGICFNYSSVSNTRPVLNKSPGEKIGGKQ